MDQALNMNLENALVHKHYPHLKIHIFYSDLAWRIQLMIIKASKLMLCV